MTVRSGAVVTATIYGQKVQGKVLNEVQKDLFCGPYYAIKFPRFGVHVLKRHHFRVRRAP